MNAVEITGKITGIKYNPFLCRKLKKYDLRDFDMAIAKESAFILDIGDDNELGISCWVSAKRTRSYPYERVYNTLSFAGKKVTIIPVFKDEGLDGDRDFLQWDTIAMMSLLGINVIVSYYDSAEKSHKYGNKKGNKITNQKFNTKQILSEIEKLLEYHSDALHWNLQQIDNIGKIGELALDSYKKISDKTGVKMSSEESGRKRVKRLLKDKNNFMEHSRFLAQRAQKRESSFTQPNENVDGSKATLTITNYLKGNYFLTCDEFKKNKNVVSLVEAKHTRTNSLPSISDIKDGLLKMILFSNLDSVFIGKKEYAVDPILKLTTDSSFNFKEYIKNTSKLEIIKLLKKEAKANKFTVTINGSVL